MSHASLETMATRLTVEQVERMLDVGILAEGAPLELIDGALVYKDRSDAGGDLMSVGTHHSLVVQLLGELDAELRPRGCSLRTQSPVRISPYDAPEPDGAVVTGKPRDYTDRMPGPQDVHAVIEVSDSSLRQDRRIKLALYARAAIGQYVIVNLPQHCVEVYEQPVASQDQYESVTVVRRGDRLALRTGDAPPLDVDVARLLP